MKEPLGTLLNGLKIRTNATLEPSRSMTRSLVLSSDSVAMRKPDTEGEIRGVVGGTGGDVYWVQHPGDALFAPYCFTEFEKADRDTEKAAAVPMTAPTPSAMAESACARRVLGQGHQEGFEEGVKTGRARAAATLTSDGVTLAKVLVAYQKADWLAVGDALYAACLLGNGKDEFGLSPIGQALLERARKEGVL